MQIGEKLEIERLGSGLYLIRKQDGTRIVGGAASTAVALTNFVFLTEATEIDYPEKAHG